MTQLQKAKNNIITEEMKIVSRDEDIEIEELLELVKNGEIVIPKNINHKKLYPKGIGKKLSTKVNVNIGTSDNFSNCDISNFDEELKKLDLAIEYKADSIMDLSISGNTEEFRKLLIEKSPLMVGTVPIYDIVRFYNNEISNIKYDDFFNFVDKHGKDGVDFITIHCGLTLKDVELFKKIKRNGGIVSRGGSIMYQWMVETGKENPYYKDFDRLCDICLKYDITLSLGDGLRPGAISDSTDIYQIGELLVLGELTEYARNKGVQVMIEGPGHIPINEIQANIQLQKKICKNAPFYVLGPVVTDIGAGYDHITAAIGGSIASSSGADFLCYVTPAEHIALPDLNDVKEGIIATKIAAHSGDLVKGIKKAWQYANNFSIARANLDWEKMYQLAIDKEKFKKYKHRASPDSKTCSMCGNFCSIKRFNSAKDKLNG